MASPRIALPPMMGHATMRDLLQLSLIAAIIGAVTGLIAVAVRVMIAFVTSFAFGGRFELLLVTPEIHPRSPWVILVPTIGALLAWGLVRVLSGDVRIRGASEIVRSVAMRRGQVSSRSLSGHALATIVSVGTGGSAGREGAMVQLAAALSRFAAFVTGASVRHRKILLGVAAGAAVASTFNTPIAGVIFAAEVVLLEWSTRSFVPITVGAAMGTLVSTTILGSEPAFPIPPYELVTGRELFLYILLGVLAGLLSIGVLRLLALSDRIFARVPGPIWVRPVIGGLGVGVLGFLVPEIFGVGYDTVRDALAGDVVPTYLAIVLGTKVLAYSVTRGSGGASGAFSPSLFMGATLGGIFGAIVHAIFPIWTASAGAYALVGMAAVYAAITRASLTSIVMLYEMTHTFSIVIPTMIAVVVADALSKAYGEGNFYRMGRGADRPSIETDAAINVLDTVLVGEIMARPVETLRNDHPVREVVEQRFRTGHQGYPVVDGDGNLVGIITSTDMRRKVKEGDLDRPIAAFMTRNPICVTPSTTAHEALTDMVRLDIGHLPVVEENTPHKLVGFITRTDLVGVERRVLEEEVPGEAAITKPIAAVRKWTHTERGKVFHREGGRPPP